MQGMEYSVDIVLCIDATGSMGSVIERVKAAATRFYDDLRAKLEEKGKVVDHLRVKIIEFRDYYDDPTTAMRESEFFVLPEQTEEFASFVRSIRADGGGDPPESGLEAIALALRSPWTNEGSRQRHVIVMWTDTSPHPLEMRVDSKPENYPQGIPSNFDELTDLWEGQMGMRYAAKRLVIFAPDATGWSEMGTHWSNSIHYPSQAGKGLSDIDYSTIMDQLAQSV